MFIKEFHARFTSKRETVGLFEALRRVSRLEAQAFLTVDPAPKWPEWPPIDPCAGSLRRA